MRAQSMAVKIVVTIGVAALVAGCVEPGYYPPPGPVMLQPYPPPVTYQSTPDYRMPTGGPIPLQSAPVIQPLPPPAPVPSVTEDPVDTSGPIPVQDMPALAPDPAAPATEPAAAPVATPAPEVVRKAPINGAGNNVPLEGFRPMKGQTRPTP